MRSQLLPVQNKSQSFQKTASTETMNSCARCLAQARATSRSRQPARPAGHQAAVEPAEYVALVRVAGEQPPGRIFIERPHDIELDQPFGDALLDGNEIRIGHPLKCANGDAEHAEQDQDRLPSGRQSMAHDLMVRRTRVQGDSTRWPLHRPHMWQSLAPSILRIATSGAQFSAFMAIVFS